MIERPTLDLAEPASIEDLEKGIRIPREDFELWLEKHDWTYHQLARKEYPDFHYRRYFTRRVKMVKPFTNATAFQLACIANDRVLFGRMFMREPDDPNHKSGFNLFDYQAKSARIQSHTIHKCGAGVGKTREIILVCLHFFCTEKNGTGLVGAVQQEHINDIIHGLEDQFRWNPWLAKGLRHHEKAPHHTMYGTNDFTLWFRPAAHDGHAFRGKHARQFAIFEEFAKADQDLQVSEFFRSVKHSCVVKTYTVPDGRRTTHAYRLAKLAEGVKDDDEAKALREALSKAVKGLGDRKFVLCHFPKTMMPPPHWDDGVKAEAIILYGGEDKPGYKHNILAEDGDPENTVFPWNEMKWVIKEIPEYRFLSVIVTGGEIICRGYRYEAEQGQDGPIAKPVMLMENTYTLAGFFDYQLISRPGGGMMMTESEFRKLIKSFFIPVSGYNRGGIDFGYAQDPTEIIIRSIGKTKRRVARLHLRHVTYDMQCQAIDALDDIYCMKNTISWGCDLGAAGIAAYGDLQGLPQYAHKNYDDRFRGFQFESTTNNLDENGEVIIDAKDGKPVKITLKELATDHMTRRIQRQTLEFPPDPDSIAAFTGHTCTQGKHRIYSKDNDHEIDAERAETLAEILGLEREDEFACGSRLR